MAKPKSPRVNPSTDKQVITMPDAGSNSVKRNSPSVSSAPASFSASDIEEKIRHRAYELYEERGYIVGYDQEDWFQAEREVLGRGEKRKMQSA